MGVPLDPVTVGTAATLPATASTAPSSWETSTSRLSRRRLRAAAACSQAASGRSAGAYRSGFSCRRRPLSLWRFSPGQQVRRAGDALHCVGRGRMHQRPCSPDLPRLLPSVSPDETLLSGDGGGGAATAAVAAAKEEEDEQSLEAPPVDSWSKPSECLAWAGDGQCASNPAFMSVQCAWSCHMIELAARRYDRRWYAPPPAAVCLHAPQPATLCAPQPAAVCTQICQRMHPSFPPYAPQPAIVPACCHPVCTPACCHMQPSLPPYASQATSSYLLCFSPRPTNYTAALAPGEMAMTFARVLTCLDTYVPGPPYCTYGLRVPASCELCVPAAQGSWCPTTRTSYVQ